jgi:hypothetical protein
VSDLILSTFLAVAVVVGLTVGILAAFPRKRRALVPAAFTILAVLAAMSVLGSALVGPVDLSALLVHVPIAASVMTVWYFWKVRPKEMAEEGSR